MPCLLLPIDGFASSFQSSSSHFPGFPLLLSNPPLAVFCASDYLSYSPSLVARKMLIIAKKEVWAKLKARHPEIELKPRSEVGLEDVSDLMKRSKVSSLSPFPSELRLVAKLDGENRNSLLSVSRLQARIGTSLAPWQLMKVLNTSMASVQPSTKAVAVAVLAALTIPLSTFVLM